MKQLFLKLKLDIIQAIISIISYLLIVTLLVKIAFSRKGEGKHSIDDELEVFILEFPRWALIGIILTICFSLKVFGKKSLKWLAIDSFVFGFMFLLFPQEKFQNLGLILIVGFFFLLYSFQKINNVNLPVAKVYDKLNE